MRSRSRALPAALAGALLGIALCVPVSKTYLANGRLSHEERLWAQEVTGLVALHNDLLALHLLPAILGVSEGPHGPLQGPFTADLPRMAKWCTELQRSATRWAPVAQRAQPRFERAAASITELGGLWDLTARTCIRAATTGDPEAPRAMGLGTLFNRLGALTDELHHQVPSVECPERLKRTIQTCLLGV